MNFMTISKLNELKETLSKAAKLWRADIHLNIEQELHLETVDTTMDTAAGYSPGNITQATRPVMYIEYWLSQNEHTQHNLIEMPEVPIMKLEATVPAIDFHIQALTKILLDYAPDEVDWKEAEAAYEKRRAAEKDEWNENKLHY